MTEDRAFRTRRRASLRKLLYVPLAVGVLAGAISAGTGIGTAAPGPQTCVPTTQAEKWWSLYNCTDQPIYGQWHHQVGSKTSDLNLVKDGQEQPLGREMRERFSSPGYETYWIGHICYDHKWWNLPMTNPQQFDGNFSLWNTADGLRVDWNATGPWSSPYTAKLVYNKAEGPC
ncbi:hypothetical protein R3Q06_22930 [Rhodococcus erythropolis]|uniref:hypothetical protein n=1 Tax=Rhodococcus erythropolis TaxID=1833 RepID=UPI002948FBDB|nr:hypothetical protein [Rhodococcus erythropolis]MDV6276357.1 hypothetical protein [Rhodococcus erythropolis]